jgi:acylpyruvate hydrolase
MRLVNLRRSGGCHAGVVIGDLILDLVAVADVDARRDLPATVRGILDAGALTAVRALQREVESDRQLHERFVAAGALVPSEGADLGAPIDDPRLLLAIGLNYHDHLREMGTPPPSAPYSFTKNLASIAGPRDDIVLPRSHPEMVDWEGELVIVIGSPCFGASERDATAHIAGYTIANDVSARDWVDPVFRQSGIMEPILAWELNLLGKQFPTFCPLGPFLVTSDEIPDVTALGITTRVNGEVMQSSSTAQLIFSPAQIVSYYSQFYRFLPGDLILTGTPAGVGFGRTPKRFLAAGDIVDVSIDSLGSLTNRVASH